MTNEANAVEATEPTAKEAAVGLGEPPGGDGTTVRHHPHLLSSLMTGAGALGVALGIERGGGFLANVLAARLGGAHVYGAYAIALAAANNVAWYVGAGIGDTATRFIGEFIPGTKAHRDVVRSLLLMAGVSAALAAVLVFAGAGPMATFILRNPELTGPLRVAAASSAAFVALECVRGLFIGTRSFGRLLFLSIAVGVGMLAVIPGASILGASHMLARQAAVVLISVVIGVVVILRQPSKMPKAGIAERESPPLKKIWKFGLMQLGGVVGMNAAGWWTASLVARWDVSLLQVAFYAVATQLRNVASLVPSLVQHSNFSSFTDEGGRRFGGAEHVVTVSSFASSALATLCSGVGVVVLPSILHYFYGPDYVNAEMAASLAVVTLMVHFGTAPAASRLLILAPFLAGVVNAIWAVFVVLTGTWLIPKGGAMAATAVLFTAHLMGMFLVIAGLAKIRALSAGVTLLAVLDTLTAGLTILLAWLRTIHPERANQINLLLLSMTAATMWGLLRLGQNHGAFPKPFRLASFVPRSGTGVQVSPEGALPQ